MNKQLEHPFSHPFHVIKDPVHGTMQFSESENNWIKPFIESALFQRLRHIKQSGLGDLIFPGAVHTRFNHALGCCYVASQIANKLQLDVKQHKLVIIAGLLHDIGHGPFSHAFEGIFDGHLIRHEDWTPLFLKEYVSSDFLNQFSNLSLEDRITQEDFELIKRLIMHEETENMLLADIVSSQLDADRLDYLRRDSHFCGVTYGDFDFRWLLHCLTIVPDEHNKLRLGITEKGIGVVEEYLMARRLMTRNVYYHGKKYAIEMMLSHFLHQLSEMCIHYDLMSVTHRALIDFFKSVQMLNDKIKNADLEKRQQLKSDFLESHYHQYKQLCDYDIWNLLRWFAQQDGNESIIELARRVYLRQLPHVAYVSEERIKKLKPMIKSFMEEQNIPSWKIGFIELPHHSYDRDQDPIWVLDRFNTVRTVQQDSVLLGGISEASESIQMLYFDQSIDETVIAHFLNDRS